jgi:SAM-dependent methyltransferase
MDARYAAAYPALYRHHWWWRVREDILIQRIGALRQGRSEARILDVGCGAGLFFDALERFGHVEGIESDRAAIEQAGRWASRIRAGELDASYRPDAPFDLILMLDVLEHVRDPESLLRRAAALLTPPGRVLITVPAFGWLWTAHDDLNHHVRRYTARGMRALVARAGLVVEDSRYAFQSLVVPKLLVRLKEAVTSAAPRVPSIPPRAINEAARSWFRLEHAIAGRLPFGSSLVAVARLGNTP